jgi:hypothetical protein
MIHLRYVKAHVGIPGNEAADALAKRGVGQDFQYFPTPVPKCNFNKIIKDHLYSLWTIHWDKQDLSQIKIWFPYLDPSLSNRLLSFKRDSFSRRVRFLTGHCFLRRQNNLVDLNYQFSTVCRKCNIYQERASHILMDCEPLWPLRVRHFQTAFLPNLPLWSPSQLHGFLKEPSIMELEEAEV